MNLCHVTFHRLQRLNQNSYYLRKRKKKLIDKIFALQLEFLQAIKPECNYLLVTWFK